MMFEDFPEKTNKQTNNTILYLSISRNLVTNAIRTKFLMMSKTNGKDAYRTGVLCLEKGDAR